MAGKLLAETAVMWPIAYRLRVEMRGSWRGVLALGVLIGLMAGVVFACVAGARRTDSAYRRFLVTQRAYDVMLRVNAPSGGLSTDDVRRLPGVDSVVETGAFYIIGFGAGVGVVVPPDDRIGTTLNRFKVLEGRRPDPRDPTEAIVSFALADEYGLEVGDRIQVLHDDALGPQPAELSTVSRAELLTARERILQLLPDNALTIVGIEAAPGEFPPQIQGSGRFLIHTSPALFPVKDELAVFSEPGDEVMVRLHNGERGTRDFLTRITRLGGTTDMLVQRDLAAGVNRSLHTQAVALYLLSVITVLAGALILSQLLARFLLTAQSDARVLAALGMTRRGRWGLGIGRAVAVGVVAAPVAVIAAAASSGLFPTGLARIAEPDPGVHLDLPVLAVGAAATILGVVLLAVWPAWRAARTSIDEPRLPSRIPWWTRALARTRPPAPVDVGVRMALVPGRSRFALASRSSLVAVALGFATLVAALVFASSLSHLLSTPALYGQSWDAAFPSYGDERVSTVGAPILASDPHVVGVGVGQLRVAFEVNGQRVDGIAVDTVAGRLGATILEGHQAHNRDEIVLGTRTMRRLHRRVGDRVHAAPFASDQPPRPMRIVGRAVFPLFGELGRLGDGAYVTRDAWGAVRGEPISSAESDVLVRLTSPSHLDAVARNLERGLGNPPYGIPVISQGKPTDIVNFGRVENTPYILGIVLAAVSISTLAYILVSSVRQQRRSLAIVKALGFVRSEIRIAVAALATTIAVVTLALGLPLGVALGWWSWTRFADDLGIATITVVPAAAITAIVAVGLLAANVTAAVPAAIAARTRAASTLRTE